MDLKNLSNEELKQVQQSAADELAKRKAEKERIKKRKEDYVYLFPLRQYKYDYQAMWCELKSGATSPEGLTLKSVESIEKRFTSTIAYRPEDVCPCPNCGKTTLERAMWDHDRVEKYGIICRACNWEESPKSKFSSDAWCHFNDWLIMRGYLPAGSEIPR